jgi:hypothetical protein
MLVMRNQQPRCALSSLSWFLASGAAVLRASIYVVGITVAHRVHDHPPTWTSLTNPSLSVAIQERFTNFLEPEAQMRAQFLGKDPESNVGDSPTLFATDRTDRVTYIAQGWKVTDPQVLADIGPIPDHEAIIEIPEDVLKFYARRYAEEEH